MSSHGARAPAPGRSTAAGGARKNSRRTRLLPPNSRENSDHSRSGHNSIIGAGEGRNLSGPIKVEGNEEPVVVSLSTLRSALDETEKEELEQERKLRLEAERAEEEEEEDDDDTAWRKLMGDDIVMKVLRCVPPLNKKKIQQVQPQDTVLMNYIARPAKNRKDIKGPIVQQAEGFLVTVGDGDVVPALEMAARFMDAGQTARVWTHSKYAMGPGVRTYTVEGSDKLQVLPPNTDMIYEVTVSQIVVDTSRLNPYFPIQKALTKKKIANDIFQHEWVSSKMTGGTPDESASSVTENEDTMGPDKSDVALEAADCTVAMKRAIRLYEKAAADMEGLLQGVYFAQVDEDHPQRQQARQIMLDTLNNSVAVHLLRLHDYHKAKQSAVRVLEQDPKNLKALLRAAKACLLDPASTLEEAKAALEAAEAEIPKKDAAENKELRRLKAQFKQQQNEYKNKSKAMFANVLKRQSKPKDDEKETISDGATVLSGDDGKDVPFWQTRAFGLSVRLVIPALFIILFLIFNGNNIVAELRQTFKASSGDKSEF